MKSLWPKSDNILTWDPENMEKYWELCSRFDQYPQLNINDSEVESQQAFSRKASKTIAKPVL